MPRKARKQDGVQLGAVVPDLNLYTLALKDNIITEVERRVRAVVLETISDVFRGGMEALNGVPADRGETRVTVRPSARPRLALPPGPTAYVDTRYRRRSRRNKRYRPEDKLAAAEALLKRSNDQSIEDIAKQFKTDASNLHRWVAQIKVLRQLTQQGSPNGHRMAKPEPEPVDRTNSSGLTYQGKNLTSWIRKQNYFGLLQRLFDSTCALCQQRWRKDAILIPDGMKRDTEIWHRVKRLLQDLNEHGEAWVKEHHKVYCRGCAMHNKDDRHMWYVGPALARDVWLSAVGRKCGHCKMEPDHISTLLLVGKEGGGTDNYKAFYKLRLEEGESMAIKKFPAICRGCTTRQRHLDRAS